MHLVGVNFCTLTGNYGTSQTRYKGGDQGRSALKPLAFTRRKLMSQHHDGQLTHVVMNKF